MDCFCATLCILRQRTCTARLNSCSTAGFLFRRLGTLGLHWLPEGMLRWGMVRCCSVAGWLTSGLSGEHSTTRKTRKTTRALAPLRFVDSRCLLPSPMPSSQWISMLLIMMWFRAATEAVLDGLPAAISCSYLTPAGVQCSVFKHSLWLTWLPVTVCDPIHSSDSFQRNLKLFFSQSPDNGDYALYKFMIDAVILPPLSWVPWRMRGQGQATGWVQCIEFSSVLWRCSFIYRKDIRTIKRYPQRPQRFDLKEEESTGKNG